MTPRTPHEDNHDFSVDFDLSQIFIGREQQLDLFDLFLTRWKKLIASAQATPNTLVTAAPSPNNKIQSLVVLLYGRGGFGKSTLLKHFHEMVREPDQHLTISKIIDWEFAIEGKRSIFNPPPGQEIDANEYFRFLCGQLADALGKRIDEFREYQSAVKAVKDARKEACGVLDSLRKDDRYAGLRRLTVDGLVTMIRTVDPTPISKVLDNETAKEALSEGLKISAEQLAHTYTKLRDHLGHKLSDYLEPALKLGLSLGRDLAHFAKDYPLLIFFDTYEEIDEGDKLLRLVMGATGTRVGWIVAGRDNLWAGSEQRKRSLDVAYGYKEIMPADRGLVIDFNVGGIGAFTISDVVEYFSQLREKVRYEPPLPAMTEEDTARIVEVTQGVPLAVKIAAGLYLEKTNLEIITEKADGKHKVVDEMVRRYLLHTRANQGERALLYGLALLRRPDQPSVIAAALGLSPEQAITSYEAELSRLHRRYSFIFTEKAEPSLHQEVRHFLRLWLLEHRRDPEIEAVNKRMKGAHEAALSKLEQQSSYPSVKARLEDDEWVETYLDLTEQQFWLDPSEGVRSALPFMIAVATYRRSGGQEVVRLGEFFQAKMKSPYRDWWMSAVHLLSFAEGPKAELRELMHLEQVTHQQRAGFPPPIPDFSGVIQAMIWWRVGRALSWQDAAKAVEWYERALCRLPQDVGLQEYAALTYYQVAYDLGKEKKQAERLPFLTRCIELKPDYSIAYVDRGHVYAGLRQYEQALQDYTRALELTPTPFAIYLDRGHVYAGLRQYEQALQDYTRALELAPFNIISWWMLEWVKMPKERGGIELAERLAKIAAIDPEHYLAYTCRGIALGLLGKVKAGLEEVERAIPLLPLEWDAYFWKGMLCAYFYQRPSQNQATLATIERSIELGLPIGLLRPLYWLEKDRPDFFKEYAKPLLDKYDG